MVTTALEVGDQSETSSPRVFRARYQNVPPPGASFASVTGEPLTLGISVHFSPSADLCRSRPVAVLAAFSIVRPTVFCARRDAVTLLGAAGVLYV